MAAPARSARTCERIASATAVFGIRGSARAAAPAVEQQHLVVLGVEADARLAHVVRHQEIDALALELRAGVRGDVVSLGGEADDERARPPRRDLRQDVGVRGQLEREVVLALDLRGRGLLGAIVGDRRRLDDDRRPIEVLQDRLAHLLGGLHRHEDGARRRRERGRTGDRA